MLFLMRPSAQPSRSVRQIECAQASVIVEAVEVVNAIDRVVRPGITVAVAQKGSSEGISVVKERWWIS